MRVLQEFLLLEEMSEVTPGVDRSVERPLPSECKISTVGLTASWDTVSVTRLSVCVIGSPLTVGPTASWDTVSVTRLSVRVIRSPLTVGPTANTTNYNPKRVLWPCLT